MFDERPFQLKSDSSGKQMSRIFAYVVRIILPCGFTFLLGKIILSSYPYEDIYYDSLTFRTGSFHCRQSYHS